MLIITIDLKSWEKGNSKIKNAFIKLIKKLQKRVDIFWT